MLDTLFGAVRAGGDAQVSTSRRCRQQDLRRMIVG
jgi:hypothetical protein